MQGGAAAPSQALSQKPASPPLRFLSAQHTHPFPKPSHLPTTLPSAHLFSQLCLMTACKGRGPPLQPPAALWCLPLWPWVSAWVPLSPPVPCAPSVSGEELSRCPGTGCNVPIPSAASMFPLPGWRSQQGTHSRQESVSLWARSPSHSLAVPY